MSDGVSSSRSSSSFDEVARYAKLTFYNKRHDKEPYKTKVLKLESGGYWKLFALLSHESQPITLSYTDSYGNVCRIEDEPTYEVALEIGPNSDSEPYLNIRVDHYQIE